MNGQCPMIMTLMDEKKVRNALMEIQVVSAFGQQRTPPIQMSHSESLTKHVGYGFPGFQQLLLFYLPKKVPI